MTDALLFSFINVGAGFVVSWLIGHYMLPYIFHVDRHAGRTTAITVIYTRAAVIRNVIIYDWFV